MAFITAYLDVCALCGVSCNSLRVILFQSVRGIIRYVGLVLAMGLYSSSCRVVPLSGCLG